MECDLRFFENKAFEKGFSKIAGIDEAGRGPLAGPVVASAVILPEKFFDSNIKDSKKTSPKQRSLLFKLIYDQAIAIGVGIVDNDEIDKINILAASRSAMAIAVESLDVCPDCLLIDGIHKIESDIPQKTIVKGDSLSISIAAASIIAKVTRDRIMQRHHIEYSEYGFDKHKGYPTKLHKEAIARFGHSPIHRKTFRGVKEHIAENAGHT